MKWRLLIVLFLLFFIILLDWAGFFYWPRSIIQFAAAPILKFFWQTNLAFSKIKSAFFEARNLEEENRRLKETNLKLLGEQSQFQGKERENEFLRQQLEQPVLGGQENFKLLLAKIISKSPENFSFQILIDKGQRDGVKIGQTVIISNRVLVGIISQVYWRAALVTLINSDQFKMEVVAGESLASGIIKGNFNSLLIDFVTKEKQLKEGELVVSSGQGDVPRGLLIGRIQSFSSRPEQIFQEVTASPFFNSLQLDNLFIILEY